MKYGIFVMVSKLKFINKYNSNFNTTILRKHALLQYFLMATSVQIEKKDAF
jgi:hypothetical protein